MAIEEKENPLIKQLQEANRREDREEIERLNEEFARQLKEQLGEVRSATDIHHQRVEAIKEDASRKANGERRRIYKELIRLYREADQAMKDIRAVKKMMRMEGSDEGKGNQV